MQKVKMLGVFAAVLTAYVFMGIILRLSGYISPGSSYINGKDGEIKMEIWVKEPANHFVANFFFPILYAEWKLLVQPQYYKRRDAGNVPRRY